MRQGVRRKLRRLGAWLLAVSMAAGLACTAAVADSGSGTAVQEIITAKVYLLYQGTVPKVINQDFDETLFGPSGNDVPYLTVRVDLDALLKKPGVKVQTRKNGGETWYYISTESCRNLSTQELWELILSCMNSGDKAALEAIFGNGAAGANSFLGYVLKKEGVGWHIDGVYCANPAYVTEVYENGAYRTVSAGTKAMTAQAAKTIAAAALNADADTLAWDADTLSGKYEKDGKAYTFTLAPLDERTTVTTTTLGYYQPQKKNPYYVAQLNLRTVAVPDPVLDPEPDPGTVELPAWSMSGSKTASPAALGAGRKTAVTLSLPAAQKGNALDVVFVLNRSEAIYTEEMAADAIALLGQLRAPDGADVKVGVIDYDWQESVKTPALLNVDENYDALVAALEYAAPAALVTEETADSPQCVNLQAAVLAGKALLDADSETPASEKYLILLSDCDSCLYDDENGVTVSKWSATAPIGNRDFAARYLANDDAPAAPEFADVWAAGAAIESEKQGEYAYDGEVPTADQITYDAFADPAQSYRYTNLEKGTYLAASAIKACADAGYQTILLNTQAPVGYREYTQSMAQWLSAQNLVRRYLIAGSDSADDAAAAFEDIAGGLGCAMLSGQVTDVIGARFTFDAAAPIVMTITAAGETGGNVTYTAQKDENAEGRYVFGTPDENGNYPYALYYQGASENAPEQLVWDIAVPVAREHGISLTYGLTLTDPESEAGEHTAFTNESAVLSYLDPFEREGSMTFPRPGVSYTVAGSSSSSAGVTLNKADHFAYIVGREDGLVHPEENITRAETATIFFRMLSDSSRARYWSDSCEFGDVTDEWYLHAVATLVNAGVLDGYSDGTFRPNQPITRAEYAALAARFVQGAPDTSGISFDDISGHWAQSAILKAAAAGYVRGSAGAFEPDRAITRAEAMTLMNRVLGRTETENSLRTDMKFWDDNRDTSVWYYAAVQEATNSHTYTRRSTDAAERWSAILPVRDWAGFETAWADAYAVTNPGDVMQKG